MLIQGTNMPIKVVFDESVASMQSIVATLWNPQGKQLKRWNTEDIDIQGDTIYLPLVEDETATYAKGKVILEIKGLDENGKTLFWQEVKITVKDRKDKIINLEEGS